MAESLDIQYQQMESTWKRVKDEVEFILKTILQRDRIKYHYVIGRVKELSSIREKLERKQLKKIEDIDDIVGLRIVCLFSSDLTKIGNLIKESFIVLSEDNKINGCQLDAFGYMSVHYIAKLKSNCQGPRYEGLRDIRFEIQVRTMLMDAWANVSHYLDYKSETAVPKDLRKDFYALSGLFYIADSHFELFYNASKKSQNRIQKNFKKSIPNLDVEINLDSLMAYMNMKFPDRKQSNVDEISNLITDIFKCGYSSIQELNKTIDKAWEAFLLCEKENPPSNFSGDTGPFAQVGVIRCILDLTDEKFARRWNSIDPREYLNTYRRLIKN